MLTFQSISRFSLLLAWLVPLACAADPEPSAPEPLRVLFIGNSFTFRHDLPALVARFAATGEVKRTVQTTAITYGGHILKQHWQLHSQNWVRWHELTEDEVNRSLGELRAQGEKQQEKRPDFAGAVRRHEDLRKALMRPRPKWDYVVLQSYRDAATGVDSEYFAYARRFAALVRAQGATPIFYDTAPETQNAEPLARPPPREPAEARARMVAQLASEFGGIAVPMPLIAWHCQTARPEIALRYRQDAHPNQTMAYLTAAAIYAGIFKRSPEGHPLSEVTETKVVDRAHPDRNPDGGPQRKVFADADRQFLQRVVQEALADYHRLAATAAARPAR
jgi:hypothetical protein